MAALDGLSGTNDHGWEMTVLPLVGRDYQVMFVADACGSPTSSDKTSPLRRLQSALLTGAVRGRPGGSEAARRGCAAGRG
jgi:nicotinamidase-related amidase